MGLAKHSFRISAAARRVGARRSARFFSSRCPNLELAEYKINKVCFTSGGAVANGVVAYFILVRFATQAALMRDGYSHNTCD